MILNSLKYPPLYSVHNEGRNNVAAASAMRPAYSKRRKRSQSTHQNNKTQLPTMPGSLSLFSVNAVLLMSADDGSRIFTKYYSPPHPPAGAAPNATDYPGANPYPTPKEQKAFEQGLLEKTNKQTSDVILYDNRIVVFKMESDVMLYVVGSAEENEVLLYNVVLSLRDALGILFKYASPICPVSSDTVCRT